MKPHLTTVSVIPGSLYQPFWEVWAPWWGAYSSINCYNYPFSYPLANGIYHSCLFMFQQESDSWDVLSLLDWLTCAFVGCLIDRWSCWLFDWQVDLCSFWIFLLYLFHNNTKFNFAFMCACTYLYQNYSDNHRYGGCLVKLLKQVNRPLSRRLDRCDRVIQNESRDPFGGNEYYVTMQITFLTRKFRNGERNFHCDVVHITTKWVSSLTLDCNGVFAIKAYCISNSSDILLPNCCK